MRILFFGRLAEIAGARVLEAPDALTTLDAVRAWLIARDAALGEALSAKGVRAAINKTIAHEDGARLQAGDEIAFMPPVSGG